MLNVLIIVTFFKYGKAYFPDNAKKFFIPISILVFATCFVLQFAFYFRFENIEASQYSAFARNATMSILFLTMLYQRNSAKGQTMLMAVAKCLGTLAPTILGGFIVGFNIYIILMGLVCLVFDIIYVVALYKTKKIELDPYRHDIEQGAII